MRPQTSQGQAVATKSVPEESGKVRSEQKLSQPGVIFSTCFVPPRTHSGCSSSCIKARMKSSFQLHCAQGLGSCLGQLLSPQGNGTLCPVPSCEMGVFCFGMQGQGQVPGLCPSGLLCTSHNPSAKRGAGPWAGGEDAPGTSPPSLLH